jgi:parallel beta-helix repeat protein
VNANPGGTAFCLAAGVHPVPSPITPKTGDSFTGQYGAVLDGTGTSFLTNNTYEGLINAHNQNIDNVTVRNLVIRDSDKRGIHAYKDYSDGWVIENNEFVNNRIGISHGNGFQIRRNLVHDNWQYGITCYRCRGSLIENNDFSSNAARASEFPGDAGASKWMAAPNTIVRDNDWHDNYGSGIWFDFDNAGILIEGNRVTSNRGSGIFYEMSGQGTIRNNVVTRNTREDIYLSEASGVEVYGNSVVTLRKGISLFIDFSRGYPLQNNSIHDNTVTVLPVAGTWAVGMTCLNLTSTDCFNYHMSHNNHFETTVYDVPDPAAAYWFVGNNRVFPGWQALGFDVQGSAG